MFCYSWFAVTNLIPSEIYPLLISALLGGIVGLERELSHKPAGLRTHILVSLGSTVFTLLSLSPAFGGAAADSARIASQVLTGMGFIGAGVVISAGGQVKGVTTAASLWVTAAIGMAVALGEYTLAVATTALVLLALLAFLFLEKPLSSKD